MKDAPPAGTDGAERRKVRSSHGVLLNTTVVNRFSADHAFSALRRNDYRCVLIDAPTAFEFNNLVAS